MFQKMPSRNALFPVEFPHLEEVIIDGVWYSDSKLCLAETVQSLSNLKCLDLRFQHHVSGSTDHERNPVNDALMTALTERCVAGYVDRGSGRL